MKAAKKFATQIEESVLKELKKFVKQEDRKISAVVSEALSEYLNKRRVRPAFRSAMNEVLDENAELLERLAK